MTNTNKEVFTTVTIEGKELRVYKVAKDQNGNKRYVVGFEDLGLIGSDYKDIEAITKYRGRWIEGIVFQSFNIEVDVKFYYEAVKNYYTEKNKRKIVMTEYHAYGRRCGWDFIIKEDNKRIENTFLGTDRTNEIEASNQYVKHLQQIGVNDWDNLDIEKIYA